jgi:hypothetical protein
MQEVMQNGRRRISGEVQAMHYFTKGLRKDGRIVPPGRHFDHDLVPEKRTP